jgi:hypothetical protein
MIRRALAWLAELPESVLPLAFFLLIIYAAWKEALLLALYLAGCMVTLLIMDMVEDTRQHRRNPEDCEECNHDA